MLARSSSYVLGLLVAMSLVGCGQKAAAKKSNGEKEEAVDESDKDADASANKVPTKKPVVESKDNEEEESKDDDKDTDTDKTAETDPTSLLGGQNPLAILQSNPELLKQLMANPQLSGLIGQAGGGSNPLAALQSNPQLLQQFTSNPQFASVLGQFGDLSKLLQGFGGKTP